MDRADRLTGGPTDGGADTSTSALAVDHLVYAAPSLDAGIDEIRAQLGVEPAPGGRHPRWPTGNALVVLGPTTYLKIIGPDESPGGAGGATRGAAGTVGSGGVPDSGRESGGPPGKSSTARPFGIDALTSPRLATWTARTTPLERAVRAARSVGFDPEAIMEESREAPDGFVLRWRLTDPTAPRDGGALPFLIDWGSSPHPAESLKHDCRLRELRVRHPEPDRIRPFLHSLHPRIVLEPGAEPAISAGLDTPVGNVVLG